MPRILLALLLAALPAAAHEGCDRSPRVCVSYVTVCRPAWVRYSYYRSGCRSWYGGRRLLWGSSPLSFHDRRLWGGGRDCDADGVPEERTAPVGARFLVDSRR